MITYSGSHVTQFTTEQGEDMILQHELHLVLVNFFLCVQINKTWFTMQSNTIYNAYPECLERNLSNWNKLVDNILTIST